jgi:hypothetical protein
MRDGNSDRVMKPRSLGIHRYGRCLRDTVEMSERQQKLDREREQREPRPKSDPRSEPFHVGMGLERCVGKSVRPLMVL